MTRVRRRSRSARRRFCRVRVAWRGNPALTGCCAQLLARRHAAAIRLAPSPLNGPLLVGRSRNVRDLFSREPASRQQTIGDRVHRRLVLANYRQRLVIEADAALLNQPMATADVMIETLMRHFGDLRLALPELRNEIEQLRREIARLLVKGESGVERLAKATGASVRTLQRRLKDADLSYSELQDDVRRTLALNLLENETLALGEIAFSLGYSEVAAFNHAFRRWVGQSPGDYRRSRASPRLMPFR